MRNFSKKILVFHLFNKFFLYANNCHIVVNENVYYTASLYHKEAQDLFR